MAYCKAGTTKNAVAALRYGEHEKDVVRGGTTALDFFLNHPGWMALKNGSRLQYSIIK